ncbi:beta-xylosidase [Amycolatopsis sp. NPDC059027]|uniref:beta-xylosidase n=1 Tax=Amycolatopsis sp. NPDC059027 TaxID=3346709 RepID=UPI00366FA018
MRRGGRRVARAFSAAVCGCLVLAGCSDGYAQSQVDRPVAQTAPSQAKVADVRLATGTPRQSGGVVAAGGEDAVYNYVPSVMLDGGRTRMWWCSQYGSAPPPGDDILYAEGPSADGPFTGPDGGAPAAVLSGAPGGFDGMHTCDPSVLRIGTTYFLYYTGAAGDHALGNAVGLATSQDGVHWTRAAGGRPILGPSHDVHRDNVYGAGQPSVVFLDGWYYLMFTDTTGKAAGWNGAGQFLVRSHDPAFSAGVEALGPKGFGPVPSTTAPRERSIVDGFSADLMWSGALDAFVIAHETAEGTTLTFWTRDFTEQPYRPLVIGGDWKEGPGLVRRPDGHAPLDLAGPCDRVPLDVVRATGLDATGAPTGLRHFGLDALGVKGCATPERTATTFDGLAMPSPERTMDLVRGGKLVRVDRRAVAVALAGQVADHPVAPAARFPLAARLRAEATVVQAEGRPLGVLLDRDTLWGLPDTGIVAANDSAVVRIPPARWDGYPRASSLGG